MDIGIIGFGFVGKSTAEMFKFAVNKVWVYDKYKNEYDSFEEVVDNSEIIFICVPTPIEEGTFKFNLNFVEDVLNKINKSPFMGTVVIKSTLSFSDLNFLHYKYESDQFSIIYNPEFLTERLYKIDARIGQSVVIGLHNSRHFEQAGKLVDLYRDIDAVKIVVTDYFKAALLKLVSNTFSAYKITFCNILYHSFCAMLPNSKKEYDKLREMWMDIGFVSPLHTNVPGHDGNYGFGGKCLPKDLAAFIGELDNMNELLMDMSMDLELKENIKNQLKIASNIMESINEYNMLVRDFNVDK